MQQNPENKRKFFQNRYILVFYFVVVFIFGVLAASVFWHYHIDGIIKNIAEQVKPSRQNKNPYTYINPLLGYDLPSNVKEFNEYLPLRNDIQNAVSQKNNPQLQSYSVYFRDLTLGRWVGVNENTGYAPASMMKVAIMIAYFKEAETNSSVLQKTLVYSSSTADEINGVPLETPSSLQVGKSYTVEQLIEAMIVSSDNGAKNALLNNINQPDLDEIYTDLGLPNPDNNNNYTISAKQYSLLLRVLYNATYLSRANSEEVLKIMSQAEYSQGLVAGLPKGTVAAQKFGENVDISNPERPVISLSNCGVIYHPTHPYLLCVMTKGTDLQVLQSTISNISGVAWREVNSYAQKQAY